MKTTIISINNTVGNDQQVMTSLEIAQVTNKKHCHVMEAIRKMEPAWMKVNGSNFRLVEYRDLKGELRPCYSLTKTECLYIYRLLRKLGYTHSVTTRFIAKVKRESAKRDGVSQSDFLEIIHNFSLDN